jgi:iron complex transport system substrate-binding protein
MTRSLYVNTRSGFLFMKKIIPAIICFFILAHCAWAAQAQEARYISLAPSTTEILFALGLEDNVVGVSSFCNYPPEALKKTKIGDFSHPNMETIVSLKPDYIFCTGLEQAPVIQELKRFKLNVYVADPATIEELLVTIQEIGKITGREKQAQELIAAMSRKIGDVKEKVRLAAHVKRVKVFVEVWHEPLMTAAKGSFVDEMIALAGGVNIAHDCIRPYCNFSAEKVVQLNPEVIILAYMDKEMPLKLVSGRFGWSHIDAVKSGRVFNDINPELLLRPGPRIAEGVCALFEKLYATNNN